MNLRASHPFAKTKQVSWGGRSRAQQSGASRRKWGSRKPWLFYKQSAGKGAGGGAGASWGSKPSRPRFRKRTILLVVLVVCLFFGVQSFVYVERNLRPPLMNIAKIRVKQIATQSINKAITEQVAQHSNSEKLIDWKMNSNGKISGFMLNYAEHMKITSQTIETVQSTLNDMKNIPEHIPLGHALNSAIISSFGPRVPVKFEPVGAVKVDLSTRQKDAGINMILVEVYIRIVAEVTIIIPFDTEPELVESEIPISYLLVVGDVPMYYYDSSGKPVGESAAQAPNISVPLGQGSGGVTASPDNSVDDTEIEVLQPHANSEASE